MAAVSVTFDGQRVNDAETTGSWTGATQETEFVYQGTYSNSVQVKTNEAGEYYYNAGVSHDYSTNPSKVWIAKAWITNYGALDGNGLILEIGTGARTAYYRYFIYSAATYPIQGGWLLIPIDPAITGYRSATTGTPTLSTINFYGIRADFSTTSRTQNVAMDAIDFISTGTGLTLAGGDGADPDGTFLNYVTFDEGTSTNRYGIVSTREGILYITGTLTIGTASATVFTDSNRTIVFPNGRFGTGFAGIKVNLANATTNVSMSAITFVGRGALGNDGGTQDTRPDFGVTNTSGVLSIDGSSFINFRAITHNIKSTITDSTFIQCQNFTQSSATIDNCTFEASPVATNTAFMTANDPSLISNSTFISAGTGHAIEITTAGTYTFTGNFFENYATNAGTAGNRAIYNNSGGLVTLNVVDGDTPSYRDGTGATTVINNAVSLEVNGVVENTQVYIATTGGSEIVNTPAVTLDTGNSYKVSSSYNYTGNTAVIVRAREMGYLPFETTGTITQDGLSVTAVWLVDPNWKKVVSGINISFTNPTTITRATGNFTTDGWLSIMSQVTVSGSSNNDGTYTISAVGTNTITISGATLNTAAAAPDITLTFTRRSL